jgi:hypothetical protein
MEIPRFARDDGGRVLAVIALFALVQLFFLPTAFRVDDTNILAIARQIAHAPLDPYGFAINWTGTPHPAFDILANPPLVPALLAGWAGVFGWSEAALHALTLLFALGALAAMAAIAKKEEVEPWLAAALLAASPAFFLSAHVVMPDMVMLALLLGAVALALHDRPVAAAACGTFVALAKYNGILLIPILLFIAWRKRSRLLAVVAGSPLLGVGIWSLFSLVQYGRVHLLVVAEARRLNIAQTLADLAAQGQHIGACDLLISILTITGLAIVPIGWQLLARGAAWTWIIPAVAGIATAALSRDLLLGAGVLFGLRLFLTARRPLAVVWILAVLVFQGVTILIAVRYLLPLAPAAVLLADNARPTVRALSVALSTLLAFGVAVGDARHAACYRDFAATLRGKRFYFAGHWGWQEYASRAGGVMIDARNPPLLQRGDMVVLAPRTFPSAGRPRLVEGATLAPVQIRCAASWPLQTTTCEGGGSWYGNEIAGCSRFPLHLPFGISNEPFDTFEVFVVK